MSDVDGPNGGGGDADELFGLVYDELRRLARARLRAMPPGATLEPTALVHEAYLRLQVRARPWHGPQHFFAAAAQAMRCILIDRARARARLRRGGDVPLVRVTDWDAVGSPDMGGDQVLALDEALKKLEGEDERKARVVMLRFFGGLGNEEIAEILEISSRTVEREWRFARAWLHREMSAA